MNRVVQTYFPAFLLVDGLEKNYFCWFGFALKFNKIEEVDILSCSFIFNFQRGWSCEMCTRLQEWTWGNSHLSPVAMVDI